MKSRKEKTVEQNAKNFHEKFYENNYAFMHYTMKDDIMKYFKREDRKFHHYLLSHGIKSERRGNNHIFYDYNKISISYVYDLFDLLKKIYEYKTKKDGNGKLVHDLIFRGHANANYQLHSSLIRDDNHLENEDEYYFDTIKSNPQAFRNARYHLDYLKTIQHYRGVSRIMDIGTNVLITIYFAVEKIDNDKHKENMGELIIFDKNKIDNSGEEPNEIKPHSVINHNIKQRKTNIINPKVEVKRFNSDTVEILASLAALKKNLKDEIKKDAYEVINECNNKCSSKTNLIEEFNKRESVKKLVHEVGQVRLNFKSVIDPRHLFNIYFSDSTFDNERITNQAGQFIIHGFVDKTTLNRKLNEIRLKSTSNSHKKDKCKLFLIDDKAKCIIRDQLEMLDIKASTIYPSLENTVKDIYF